jgi:DNA-binding PadR family transcriptional regulator
MTRRPDEALPLTPTTFLLLLVLAEEDGPQHGYAIKKAMEERSGGTISMDPGGFYRQVGRLERDRFVRRVASPPDETDERRQYIAITEWGRAVLAAESRRIASLARLPAVQALAREAR